MSITNKIDVARKSAEDALSQGSAYPYLPAIIRTLVRMSDACKKKDVSECRKLASGLGRLVSEDINFMESSLGGMLSDIVTDAYKLGEGRGDAR